VVELTKGKDASRVRIVLESTGGGK
jgi:hypothetical protein